MSDGAAASPMWTPPAEVWDGVPRTAATFILALVLWKDGRGSCDATEEEIGGLLRADVSTVSRWAKAALKTELVKRERRRRPDNSLGGYRYWLDLEKLGLRRGDPANCMVAPERVSSAEATPQDAGSPVENAGATPQIAGSPTLQIDGSRPGKMPGPIEPGARARARVLSNPIPPSFAFRDDEQRFLMEAIAEGCGVGLCRFDEVEDLADSLAIAIDKWLVEGFDPDLDIVPTLKRLTRHKRAKPIYDFGVDWIATDIRDHRAARLDRETKRAAKAQAAAGAPRAKRGGMDELDRMLARGRAQRAAAMTDADGGGNG